MRTKVLIACVAVAVFALPVTTIAAHSAHAAARRAPSYLTCAQSQAQFARNKLSASDLKAIAAMRALNQRPHDPGAAEYALAEIYARTHQYCNALVYLRKTMNLHQGWDPENDPFFAGMARVEGYRELLRLIRSEFPAVRRSRVAFTLPDPHLIPENVSYDPASGDFYVSSVYRRKVLRIARDGRVSDFLSPRQFELWSVIGMKVDPGAHALWICTAAINEARAVSGSSALLEVDLRSGRLLHRYVIPGGETKHLLNDLVLDRRGNVYITDSLANTVYWLPAATHKLAVLVPGLDLNFPNGIDLDPTQRYLYVAYSFGGIDVIDLRTKRYRRLGHPPDVTLEGIDGMYYYRGSLVAVQNGIGTERVARYYLDFNGDRVLRAETLEFRNPALQQSTEGCMVGSALYYVGNSENFWLRADGTLDPSHRFTDPAILRLEL